MSEAVHEGARRLRLTIAYDGLPWKGWQSLPDRQTVQDQVESGLQTIAGAPIRLHGSGRTDTGVHALGQVAHCDVPAYSKLTKDEWANALNAVIPLSIRIVAADFAPSDFHARFDAKGKVYRYRIWRAHMMSPFELGRAWHVFGNLDDSALDACAAILAGTHNFSRLSANRGDMSEQERRQNPEDVTRTLCRADILREREVLELELEGDGFLYKMVRLMVGTMIHVARGRDSVAWFRSLLDDPAGAKSHHMAPPEGLYLVRVLY